MGLEAETVSNCTNLIYFSGHSVAERYEEQRRPASGEAMILTLAADMLVPKVESKVRQVCKEHM